MGFQRELVPFVRGFGGQRPPTSAYLFCKKIGVRETESPNKVKNLRGVPPPMKSIAKGVRNLKKMIPALTVVLLILLLTDATSASVFLLGYSKVLGLVCLVPAVVLTVLCTISIIVFMKDSLRHISQMNSHLENSLAEYINVFSDPVAVIDKNRRVLWFNRSFAEITGSDETLYGTDMEDSVTLDYSLLLSGENVYCHIGEREYITASEKFENGDIHCFVLCFHDQTEYIALKNQAEESHPNVIVISVDSYDEIAQNAKESEKSQASAETEKLIENFIGNTNGFVKKSSASTFYAIVETRHLNEIINGKFQILDTARSIKISGKYPLTFSIGVGTGANSLAESEKIARQCLDMAQGRGGDQAVIKTDGGYEFFGGVSKGMEKKSHAKTRILSNAMQDIINNSNTVYIMGHRFGDLDSVGASCGMAGAIRLLGKEVHIAVDRTKNLASHLIDIVEQKTDNDLFITPQQAVDSISDNDLLIIVDTHNKSYIESPELYSKAKNIIVIDHHRKVVNYIDNAVIFHHEPCASSASEMVTEVIQYFDYPSDEKIPPCHADALLSGIMLDTKNFVVRTGVRTFEAAAYLKKLGADTVAVKQLFSNSIDSYMRKTQIVASAKVHNKCAVAVADFESDDIRLVAPQAADELLGITDVDASFVIYRTGSTTNVSARSLGALNVQVIMEQLGGGGHQTMAATQLENVTADEAYQKLVSIINSTSQ